MCAEVSGFEALQQEGRICFAKPSVEQTDFEFFRNVRNADGLHLLAFGDAGPSARCLWDKLVWATSLF
ncbi:hypothetical protein LMTR3_15325 [Bradyrhizobium sp. LMTR 3]|nr:hypothetical protein LMTR3_15325 [Bradyrhizobium sp. LMTR 3]